MGRIGAWPSLPRRSFSSGRAAHRHLQPLLSSDFLHFGCLPKKDTVLNKRPRSKILLGLALSAGLTGCGLVNTFIPDINIGDPLQLQHQSVNITMDTEAPPTQVETDNQGQVTVLPDELTEPGSEVEMNPDPPEDAAQFPAPLQPQASGRSSVGPRTFNDVPSVPVVPKKLSVVISNIKIQVKFPRGFRPRSRLVLSHFTIRVTLRDVAAGSGSVALNLSGGSRLSARGGPRLPNLVLPRQTDRIYASVSKERSAETNLNCGHDKVKEDSHGGWKKPGDGPGDRLCSQ